ncbi:MAG: hypothetical protein ABIA76_03140 [Candidatus Diapherotrites archaeon]
MKRKKNPLKSKIPSANIHRLHEIPEELTRIILKRIDEYSESLPLDEYHKAIVKEKHIYFEWEKAGTKYFAELVPAKGGFLFAKGYQDRNGKIQLDEVEAINQKTRVKKK